MGLGTNTRGIYLHTYKGKITRKVEATTEGAIERVNKLGDKVYELHYDYVEGLLVDVKLQQHEKYGRSLMLELVSDGQVYNLQIPARGGYANGIYRRMPNIDWQQPLRLVGYNYTQDDKEYSGLYVIQGGEKVEFYYTKETPNGMPDVEEKEINGEKVWDQGKRVKFFLEKLANDYLPIIRGNKDSFESLTSTDSKETKEPEEELEFNEPEDNKESLSDDEFDDLPF